MLLYIKEIYYILSIQRGSTLRINKHLLTLNVTINQFLAIKALTFFTFSQSYMVEKVLFWGKIFEIRMDRCVLRFPESENHIFSGWSACVCVFACYGHIYNTSYSRNLKSGVLHLYYMQMLLEAFYEGPTNSMYKGTHKMILIH